MIIIWYSRHENCQFKTANSLITPTKRIRATTRIEGPRRQEEVGEKIEKEDIISNKAIKFRDK